MCLITRGKVFSLHSLVQWIDFWSGQIDFEIERNDRNSWLHDLTILAKVNQSLLNLIYRQKAQDAPWIGETYGLLPESLTLRDKTGLLHEINLKETPTGKLTSTRIAY